MMAFFVWIVGFAVTAALCAVLAAVAVRPTHRGIGGGTRGVALEIYGSHVDILRFICYLNSRHDETIVRTTRPRRTSGAAGTIGSQA